MAGDLIPYGEAKELPSRGLTAETCQKWNYTVSKADGHTVQVANYRDDLGQLAGQKLRTKDKSFSVRGSISDLLYGKWLWKGGGRRVIITEGEIDALTVSQVLSHKWQVVSLPNGVSSARKTIAKHLEWLNSFEQVVLCFDMDEPGREGVQAVAPLFKPGKLHVVHLPLKDPNEMLQANRVEELVRCLWDAKAYRPDGIKTVREIRASMRAVEWGMPWVFPTLTERTYGRRYGECVALGAGTGMGKTTFLTQQIVDDLTAKRHVGVFAFEQLPDETVRRVAGQMAGQTFHIPDSGWTDEQLNEALDKLETETGQLFVYDHFGACDWDVVKERIRYLRHAHDVRVFYLDHLTALAAAFDDERRGLEVAMAELGMLVKELDIWLLFVSHLATPEGKSHEEGGRVMAKHFKGSRAIMQWSHFMIGFERNTQSDDPEEREKTTVRVLKDRYTGRANGLTFTIAYDTSTGLLKEADFAGMEADESPDEF